MFKIVLVLIFSVSLLFGCSNKEEVSKTVDPHDITMERTQVSDHKNIRDEMYKEAAFIYNMIYDKMKDKKLIDEMGKNSVMDFGHKYVTDNYPDMTQEEKDLRYAIISMAQANSDYQIGVLDLSDKEKEDALAMFNEQSSKARNLLGLK